MSDRAPASCRYGCGAQVYRHTDEIGCHHQINTNALPPGVPTVLPLWRHRGPRVGWVHVDPGGRKEVSTETTVHTEHDCGGTPARRRPPRYV